VSEGGRNPTDKPYPSSRLRIGRGSKSQPVNTCRLLKTVIRKRQTMIMMMTLRMRMRMMIMMSRRKRKGRRRTRKQRCSKSRRMMILEINCFNFGHNLGASFYCYSLSLNRFLLVWKSNGLHNFRTA